MIKKRMLINYIPLSFIILAFMFDSPQNIINGLWKIVTHQSILVTDYLEIGGLGATLINASLITILNLYIIKKNDLRIGGGLFAAFLTTIGFSFFGKNILNILPIYLGTFLYSKYQKIEYKNVILIAMFAASIAPLVSIFTFGLNLNPFLGIFLGITIGILSGFFITPIAGQAIKFHNGYNLYNVGFSMGIIGMIITSIIRGVGYTYQSHYFVSEKYHTILFIYILIMSLIFLVTGLIKNNNSFKGYNAIIKSSGRTVTNFVSIAGIPVTFINIGIMGLLCLSIVLVLNIKISGPVFAGILTVLGFSAFGKHPRNVLPVMIGAILAIYIFDFNLNLASITMSIFFASALSPLAGQFGVTVGVLAGLFHMLLVSTTSDYHGFVNLYNNGFSAGFIAAITIAIMDSLNKKGSV